MPCSSVPSPPRSRTWSRATCPADRSLGHVIRGPRSKCRAGDAARDRIMDTAPIGFSPGLISLLQRAHTKQQEIFLNHALGTKGLVAAFLSMSPSELHEFSAELERDTPDFPN